MSEEPYRLVVARSAARALAESLPLAAALAAREFMLGPLLQSPRVVGKPLDAPLAGQWSARRGEYRVIYRIDERARTVEVVAVRHRRDAYR